VAEEKGNILRSCLTQVICPKGMVPASSCLQCAEEESCILMDKIYWSFHVSNCLVTSQDFAGD